MSGPACPKCNGTGRVRGWIFRRRRKCAECAGTGRAAGLAASPELLAVRPGEFVKFEEEHTRQLARVVDGLALGGGRLAEGGPDLVAAIREIRSAANPFEFGGFDHYREAPKCAGCWHDPDRCQCGGYIHNAVREKGARFRGLLEGCDRCGDNFRRVQE